MANGQIFGHLLEELTDGVTVFREGVGKPMPLTSTDIDIEITSGLAVVVTTRTFTNREDVPIEAILTMPVGFNAIVTGLSATIDGRRLRAQAKAKTAAREAYEDAIDRGKLAVLHEEALRGIHVLSVGQLPPGKEVAVELRIVLPLAVAGAGTFLRLPMTTGQLYGSTPLQPTDDLIVDASVRHVAKLRVRSEAGRVVLAGIGEINIDQEVETAMDRAIEITIEGGSFGTALGVSADGHQVRVDLRPQEAAASILKLAVLVDRSGSTSEVLGSGSKTVLAAMRDGLADSLSALRNDDHIALWQFSDDCQRLGTGSGSEILQILKKLNEPDGGTRLGQAIKKVAESGIRDILVLTDGQTWDTLPPLAATLDIRVSAVLVGKASLDANIGHLCAMTGGDLFYAPEADVASSVRLAIDSKRSTAHLRQVEMAGEKPVEVRRNLGGVSITARWSDAMQIGAGNDIGRYAAGLCLGQLGQKEAQVLALAEGLCSHATSLVLVDEAGEASQGLSETRKVPLMAASASIMPIDRASFSDAGPVRFMMRMQSANHSQAQVDEPPPPTREQVAERLKLMAAKRAAEKIWPQKNLLTVLNDEPVVSRWKEKKAKEAEAYLASVAEAIDWDNQSNSFLGLDFHGLMPNEEAVVSALEQRPGIAAIAVRTGASVRLLVLAYLASRFVTHSRAAQRLAKRILSQLGETQVMADIEDQIFTAHWKVN